MKKLLVYSLALLTLAFTACKQEGLSTDQLASDGVTLKAFGPSPALRTTPITLIGTHLDNVSEVIFLILDGDTPKYKGYSSFASKKEQEIIINVPDEALAGNIALKVASDTIWSVTPLTFEEDIEVKTVSPTKDLTAGDVITIEGEYLWNVASITFTQGIVVDVADFESISRKQITVKVPMEAVSGALELSDGADWTYSSKELEIHTTKITSISTDSLDFGDELVIKGEYFNLVTQLDFPSYKDVDYVMNQEGTEIKVIVPSEVTPGPVTLTLASLLTVQTDPIKLPMAEIYSTGPKTEDLFAGDEITVTGRLLDRIQRIELPNGTFLRNVKYVQQQYEINEDGTEITFKVVEKQGDGAAVFVQNSNYSVSSDRLAMHKDGNIFYEIPGGCNLGTDWSTWWQAAYNSEEHQAFKATITGPGTLTINFEELPECTYWQIKTVWADWSTIFEGIGTDVIQLEAGQKYVSYPIVQADVDFLQNDNGWVYGGYGVILKSFEWKGDNDPVVLWQGEAEADNWGNQPGFLSDGGAELTQAGAKAGQTLKFYVEPIREGEIWQCQVVEGHWDGTMYGFFTNDAATAEQKFLEDGTVMTVVEDGIMSVEVTEEMLTKATTQQWWGNVFLLNGTNTKCTKLTIQ